MKRRPEFISLIKGHISAILKESAQDELKFNTKEKSGFAVEK